MKKSIVFTVAALTIGLGASYLACGRVIQKTYYQTVAQLNANREFKINIVSYSPGLLNSEAKLEVSLDNGSKNNSKKINIKQKISHGPLVFVSSHKGFAVKIAAAVVTTTPDTVTQQLATTVKDQINVTTLIYFNRDARSWLSVGASEQDATKTNIIWSKINGELQHDLNFSTYSGNISIPKVIINSDKSTFAVNDLMFYFDAGSQEQSYFHNNVIQAKAITLARSNIEDLNIANLSANLDFSSNAQNQLGLKLTVNIPQAQILEQRFANETALLQIVNINPINIPKLGLYNSLNLKTAIDMAQSLTSARETSMQLELPKEFSNAFISYISFDLYRNSILGKFDRRDDAAIRKDITASVNNLIQAVLKQRLFIDQGKFYALNFEGATKRG